MIKSKDLNFDFWDLDSTLVDTNESNNFDLSTAPPIKATCQMLRKSAKEGRSIFIFSSRHWSDYKEIKQWLKKHRIPFKAIICGKPLGRRYFDDKAVNPFCKECLSR